MAVEYKLRRAGCLKLAAVLDKSCFQRGNSKNRELLTCFHKWTDTVQALWNMKVEVEKDFIEIEML